MTTPRVTEIPRAYEPVQRDTFINTMSVSRGFVPLTNGLKRSIAPSA